MWSITAIDIESTLRKVCVKVMHDSFVSPDARLRRKRGLVKLGQIFSAKAEEHMSGDVDQILSEVLHCITIGVMLHASL